MIQQKTEQVYPLSELCRVLTGAGPPSVAALAALFEDVVTVKEFWALVDEYLPEYKSDIQEAGPGLWTETFAKYFDQNYFPIDGYGDNLEAFVYECPIVAMGMNYEEYCNFAQFNLGYVLMLGFIGDPEVDSWEREEEQHCGHYMGMRPPEEMGVRLGILDYLSENLGKDLVDKVPAKGWSLESLHLVLDNTRYAGLAGFADIVWHESDFEVLNCSEQDEFSYPPWDKEEIGRLAEEWQGANVVIEAYRDLAKWLEASPRDNFKEVLDYLLGSGIGPIPLKKDRKQAKESEKTLREIFSEERGDNGTDN